MLQQLNQWGPEAQGLEVVGVVDGLDELFEVVKGDELVLEVRFIRVQDLHGSLHQVGLRRPAEQSIEHVRSKSAGGLVGAWRGSGGTVGILLGGVLDTPFEELVHLRVHGDEIGNTSMSDVRCGFAKETSGVRARKKYLQR